MQSTLDDLISVQGKEVQGKLVVLKHPCSVGILRAKMKDSVFDYEAVNVEGGYLFVL